MSRDELEAVAARWMRCWTDERHAIFDEIHAPDFVDHDPAGRGSDRAAFREGIEELLAAFPDFRASEIEMVVDEARSRVAIRWLATGRHAGAFMGFAPTERTITFKGIEILVIREGRVVERWGEWDGAALLAQLSSAATAAEAAPSSPSAEAAPASTSAEAAPSSTSAEAAPASTSADHRLTILAVSDLATAVSFYREAFGWSAAVEVPVYVEFALPGERRLGLYERHAFSSNTGRLPVAAPEGEIVGTELYFFVPDLDEAIARLARCGARELSPRALRPWGDEAAYFADPDGNVLVVAATSTVLAP